MTFGVTTEGFKLKRLADIQDETAESFRASFGQGINLEPESFIGQIKGILDEREALIWELAQAVYNSQYPLTASGVNLDQVASITGVTRLLPTTSKVTARIFGDLGTVVPVGFVASVIGNQNSKFETGTSGVIHSGIDETQIINFSNTPTSGDFKLKFKEDITPALNHNSTNIEIQTQLNLLDDLSSVIVTGNFVDGFTVTFAGDDAQKEQPLIDVLDNTLSDGNPILITISEVAKGYLPHVDLEMIAQNTGPISANTGALTVIETPVSGIESLTNLEDAILGRNLESDSALKLRRLELLQRSGVATVEGIRNKVLGVTDVIQALVVENTQLVPDIDGRPGKSFEVIVLGGDDQELANTIFNSKPAGIESHGSVSKTVIDSQGGPHLTKFSRPTEKYIYITIDITPNTDPEEGEVYPSDGDANMILAILELVKDFRIGQDVIVSQFFTPINTIAGVHGMQVFVGLSPLPTQSNNISISPTELARFDSSRITVNS